MLRSSTDSLLFVVEGDSDVRALRSHIDINRCEVIGGYGKQAVLDAIHVITSSDPDGVVALVDRDFDPWLQAALPANVFHTERYDLAADLLLLSGLLARYVDGSLDRPRATTMQSGSTSDSIVSMIVNIAACVGRLRWSSLANGLALKLRDFPISRIVDYRGKVAIDAMIMIAIERSSPHGYTPSFIRTKFESPVPLDSDDDLCSGHDLTSAVVATQNYWSRSQISRDNLVSFMIMSIRPDILHGFIWFHQLSEWAYNHGQVLWKRE